MSEDIWWKYGSWQLGQTEFSTSVHCLSNGKGTCENNRNETEKSFWAAFKIPMDCCLDFMMELWHVWLCSFSFKTRTVAETICRWRTFQEFCLHSSVVVWRYKCIRIKPFFFFFPPDVNIIMETRRKFWASRTRSYLVVTRSYQCQRCSWNFKKVIEIKVIRAIFY